MTMDAEHIVNSMHIILHYIEQKKDSIPDITSSLCQVTLYCEHVKAVVYNLIRLTN